MGWGTMLSVTQFAIGVAFMFCRMSVCVHPMPCPQGCPFCTTSELLCLLALVMMQSKYQQVLKNWEHMKHALFSKDEHIVQLRSVQDQLRAELEHTKLERKVLCMLFVDGRLLHMEGALVCRARAGQLFGLLLIPTPIFGVDSTPRMGEWEGWWDGEV